MDEIRQVPLEEVTTEGLEPNPVIPNDTPSKKKPSKILIVLFVVLLLSTLLLYAIFSLNILEQFNLFSKDNNNENIENTVEEENDIEEVFTTFEGETVIAELPEGWSIEEYYDGNGTDMLVEGMTFTGLTGLKIFKEDTEIFFLRAIYGIGFPGCPSYAKFADESPTYWQEIEDMNNEMGDTTTVTDYTNTEYIEFVWLGTTFRRIEEYYNYDTIPNNQYFEPSCVPSILSLDGIEFLPEEGPAAKSYDYGATETATLEDLLVVDSILEGMVLSN